MPPESVSRPVTHDDVERDTSSGENSKDKDTLIGQKYYASSTRRIKGALEDVNRSIPPLERALVKSGGNERDIEHYEELIGMARFRKKKLQELLDGPSREELRRSKDDAEVPRL